MTTTVRVRAVPSAPVIRARVTPAMQPLQAALRNTGSQIQWRIGQDGVWQDLIEIDDLDASVEIGTVTTLSPGSPATVTNVGTAQDAILDFGIPAGADGVMSSVVAGTGIDVDNTDPANPEVSLDSATLASLGKADTAIQPGDVPIYETITGMSAIEVPAGIHGVRVDGAIAIGDGGGGFYVDHDTGSSDTFTSGGATTRQWYRAVFESVASDYYQTSRKIDFVAGVLRQNPSDRTKWVFLDDVAHRPVGFDSTASILGSDGSVISPSASGQTLVALYKLVTDARQLDINSPAAYDRILACVVTPDEEITNKFGITLGGRVTRTGIQILGSMHKAINVRVYYNGSWQITDDGLHDGNFTNASYDSSTGVLTIDHDWIPGQNVTVLPDSRSGNATSLFLPVRHTVTNTQIKIQFLDLAGTGAVYTGAASTNMNVRITKAYDGPVYFDGTNGFDNIPWSTSDAGNIWVFGIMQRS